MAQMYAVGTASAAHGALVMLAYSAGTVPMLFIFGTMNTFLNLKSRMFLAKAGALVVILLSVAMIGKGVAISSDKAAGGAHGRMPCCHMDSME
jgi:sulfite exporter TauE/SafE